jgi:hypothetical protein
MWRALSSVLEELVSVFEGRARVKEGQPPTWCEGMALGWHRQERNPAATQRVCICLHVCLLFVLGTPPRETSARLKSHNLAGHELPCRSCEAKCRRVRSLSYLEHFYRFYSSLDILLHTVSPQQFIAFCVRMSTQLGYTLGRTVTIPVLPLYQRRQDCL